MQIFSQLSPPSPMIAQAIYLRNTNRTPLKTIKTYSKQLNIIILTIYNLLQHENNHLHLKNVIIHTKIKINKPSFNISWHFLSLVTIMKKFCFLTNGLSNIP